MRHLLRFPVDGGISLDDGISLESDSGSSGFIKLIETKIYIIQ